MGEETRINEILKDLYKDVSEWLKFAEAKNAALLTFNGVLLFGIIGVISSANKLPDDIVNFLYFCSFLLLINIVIILCSFLPALRQTNKTKNKQYVNYEATKNYLYYGDIHNLNEQSLLLAIKEKYKMNFDEANSYNKDLGLQILSVSAIAWRKYKYFTFCTRINLFIFLITIIKLSFVII
ncbi:Pycsar system effector family protein [Bacillus solitudinis]|uniref:Pycsar system effector family protein n=1 Tax=Bacillus solitudinis TaxID=2014074 RepID=UPI000C2503EF|nr:Pycsar system effector family protein [Bacillus solitudinis]